MKSGIAAASGAKVIQHFGYPCIRCTLQSPNITVVTAFALHEYHCCNWHVVAGGHPIQAR